MAKLDYEIAIFELIPQDSGFMRQGTEMSLNPEKIRHPKNRRINNKTVRYEYNETAKATVPVKLRYIKGVPIIEEEVQKKNGYTSNPNDDVIEFKNGLLTVPNHGSTVGLFKLMREHAQNLSNENRPEDERLEPIFSELRPGKEAQSEFETDLQWVEAGAYIKQLISKQGSEYVYAEERIDMLCLEFGVVGEEYSTKIAALTAYAKVKPFDFLDRAKKTEQTVLIEVSHALKLNVIVFEGNTAMYVKAPEKIKSFPGKMDDNKKVSALGNWFKTEDGKEAYEKFKIELDAAKDEQSSKQ